MLILFVIIINALCVPEFESFGSAKAWLNSEDAVLNLSHLMATF